jgi:hypothetical protein
LWKVWGGVTFSRQSCLTNQNTRCWMRPLRKKQDSRFRHILRLLHTA